MENEFNLEPSVVEDEYREKQIAKEKFETSQAAKKYNDDLQQENSLEELDEQGQKDLEDNSPGFFDYMGGFVEHSFVGLAKGIEETGQTFGYLEDNAWNLPEPENIVESLGQGIGQFLPMFFGGVGVIRGGLMMTNVLSKSGALTTAGKHLTSMGAGIFSDAIAFDPKDDNMGNMALSIGAISNSPTASAFVKTYLAQNDEDSEAVARSKSALTGLIAGEITGALIRGAGYTYRKIKPVKEVDEVVEETATPTVKEIDPTVEAAKEKIRQEQTRGQTRGDSGVTLRHEKDEFGEAEEIYSDIDPEQRKGIEEASQALAEDTVEVIDGAKAQGGFRNSAGNDLPELEPSFIEEGRRTHLSESWEKVKAEDPRYEAELVDGFHKMLRGEGVPPEEMMVTKKWRNPKTGEIKEKKVPLIHSMNFLKHDTVQGTREALQFLARKFDTRRMVKPSVADKDLDIVLEDMVEDFHMGDMELKDAIIDELGTKGGQVLDNIRYVGAVKVMNLMSLEKQKVAYEKFAKSGDLADKAIVDDLMSQHEMLQRAGGLLSYGYSKGLAAHRRKVGLLKDKDRMANDLRTKVNQSTKKLKVRSAKAYSKRLAQEQKKTNEVLNKGELTEDVEFTIRKDGRTEATYKTTRRTKVTAEDTKKGAASKKRFQTAEEVIARIVKRKKKQIQEAKSPTRGSPYKNQSGKPRLTSPEIKALDAELSKIKADRAKADKKWQLQAKEQLQYRKEFEKLSDEIEQLQKTGTIVRKNFKTKKLKPVEIADLVAQKKKLLKETKKKLTQSEKEAAQLDTLNKEYSDLLMKRLEADPEIKATNAIGQENPLIKELKKNIKREKQRLSDRTSKAELQDALKTKAEANMYDEINQMNLRQLRTRMANLHKHWGTKTKDAFIEVYVNGLLSSVKTIGMVNPIGNTSAFMSTVIERAFAGATGDQIAMRESVELAWGFLSNLGEGWRTFLSAMKSGPADWNVKFDLTNPNERAISKEAFNAHGSLGQMIDYMGTTVNLPGKLLLSFDEAFKGLVVRGETRALAWRKARSMVGNADIRNGNIKGTVREEFDNILNNLHLHDDITEGARETAAKNSFTNDLADKMVKDHKGVERPVPGMSKSIQQALDRNNLMKIFIPFFRTPVNILNFTWERTPVLQFFNGQLRKELSGEMGKATQQLARARVGTSMALVGSVYSMAMSGNFTGAPPTDRRMRANMVKKMGGENWYSFYAFGAWRKYDRLDPFGALLSATASMATMSKTLINLDNQAEANGDRDGEILEKYNEVINATFLGVGEMLKDRHYIQGISEFVSGIMGDDRGITPMFKRVATFADPRIGFYSSFRRGMTRGQQPVKGRKLQRNVGQTENPTFMEDIADEMNLAWDEALRDVIPGYGNISPEKDLMGNIVHFPGTHGEFDTIHNTYQSMGFHMQPDFIESQDPVITKLAELESDVAQPSSIKKVGNTVMTEKEKDYLIDTWTALNKRTLTPLIKSSYFKKAGEGIQKLMLENMIRQNKEAAKQKTLGEFERLKESYMNYMLFNAKRSINPDKPQGFQQELFR